MKAIIYTSTDGRVCIVRPAPWARLCRAITYDGKRVQFEPRPFDQLVRRYKTVDLAPEWAETEDKFVRRIMEKDVPSTAREALIIDDSLIPADRTFRAAWTRDVGRLVSIDMSKAREIHRDRMRSARGPKLRELDVAYQRADEAGDIDQKRTIAAEKQTLRDITAHPDIDNAMTPDALKAIWPEVLG
jgi:hypothetical protein